MIFLPFTSHFSLQSIQNIHRFNLGGKARTANLPFLPGAIHCAVDVTSKLLSAACWDSGVHVYGQDVCFEKVKTYSVNVGSFKNILL